MKKAATKKQITNAKQETLEKQSCRILLEGN